MNNPKAILLIFALLTIGLPGVITRGTVLAQDAEWTIQFGTPFSDRASRVTTDSFGNLYVVGATNGKFPAQERAGGESTPSYANLIQPERSCGLASLAVSAMTMPWRWRWIPRETYSSPVKPERMCLAN